MATVSDGPDDGHRLEPWIDGRTRSRIRWIDQARDHDELAVTERAALDLLAFIRDEPEAALVALDLDSD